jgi:hypothetical protein
VVVVARQSNLNGDITLAVAAIAAEFGVDAVEAPEGVTAILRAFSAAHYNAGVRDTMVRLANTRAHFANEPVPSSTSTTPIVGPHGRRMRSSRAPAPDTVPLGKSNRPTPLVPPPLGVVEDDDD